MKPKFRAWTGTEMRCDIVGIDWDESFEVHNAWLGNNIEYNADNFLMNVIPLQYTGLLDKNGVEIYEGDVITEEIGEGEYLFAEVIYKDGCFLGKERNFEPEYPISDFVKGKVIGNIYQNPELIKNET